VYAGDGDGMGWLIGYIARVYQKDEDDGNERVYFG
jgi:hypothetical protein